MTRKSLGAAAFVLCVASWLLLAGCWDFAEPEDMAHVLAMGFDLNEAGDLFKVYAQIERPPSFSGEGRGETNGAGRSSKPFWTASAYGRTPSEAMRNIVRICTKKVYWSHASVVVISERLARKGIQPILDVFERDRELRTITYPLVCEGDIESLMEAEFPLQRTGAEGLLRGVIAVSSQRSTFVKEHLSEAVATLSEPGIEMMMGRVAAVSEEESKGSSSASKEKSAQVEFSGAAIFRKDKMVGWLNEQETRGWYWLAGKVSVVPMVVQTADGETFTVEISHASRSVKPMVRDGAVRMNVEVKVVAQIRQISAPPGRPTGGLQVEPVERQVERRIREDVEAAVLKAQSLGSDIFGFGASIYRSRYAEWVKMSERWDEIFPTVAVDLNVKARTRRSGLIADQPLKKAGDGQ